MEIFSNNIQLLNRNNTNYALSFTAGRPPQNAKKTLKGDTVKSAEDAIRAAVCAYISFNRRFSPVQQKEIIKKFRKGELYKDIAKEYDCCAAYISKFIHSQSNFEKFEAENRSHKNTFTPKQEANIIKHVKLGLPYRDVAKRYKCTVSAIKAFLDKQVNKSEIFEKRRISVAAKNQNKIDDIVSKASCGISSEEIAKEHGCSITYIDKIIREHPENNAIRNESRKNKRKNGGIIGVSMSEEEKNKVIDCYKKGMSVDKIVMECHCSPDTITKTINNHPLKDEIKAEHKKNIMALNKTIHKFLTVQEKADIAQKYKNGMSCREIAYEYGHTYRAIWDILKKIKQEK